MRRQDWRTRYKVIFRSQLRECPYCGCDLGFHQLKCGKWVPVEAIKKDGDRDYRIIIGSGNNYNLVPIHKCRQVAESQFEHAEHQLNQLIASAQSTNKECIKLILDKTKELKKEWTALQRKNVAMCIRSMRKLQAESNPKIKSMEAYVDSLVQRATAVAVFLDRK
jgi:uncharacterized tellurite resistance protein B-like protein